MGFIFNPFSRKLDSTGSGGSGDVVGPAGATADDIPLFDGATGKRIKDSGFKLNQFVPYTGATSDVNLGEYTLSAAEISLNDKNTGETRRVFVKPQSASNVKGNNLVLAAGDGNGTEDGGNLIMQAGVGGLTGNPGKVGIADPVVNTALFDTSLLVTADRTFTFPNHSGNFLVDGADVDLGSYKILSDTFVLGGVSDQVLSLYGLSGKAAIFDNSLLTGTDKTFTFPNKSGTVALTSDIPSKHIFQGTFDLAGIYDSGPAGHEVWLVDLHSDVFPSGITITLITVDCSSADPTTELDADLMYCDAVGAGAFPGANATVISAIDTTTGNYSSGVISSAVATGKSLYIKMNADPTDANTVFHIRIHYT